MHLEPVDTEKLVPDVLQTRHTIEPNIPIGWLDAGFMSVEIGLEMDRIFSIKKKVIQLTMTTVPTEFTLMVSEGRINVL